MKGRGPLGSVARALALNAVAAALVLGAGEACARAWPWVVSAPPPGVRPVGQFVQFVVPSGDLLPGRRGFRFVAPPRGPEHLVEWDHTVVLNRLGLHGPDHGPRREPGRLRVVILGDSMLHALHVPAERTLAGRLEALLPGVEALTVAAGGAGPATQGLLLDHAEAILRDGEGPDVPDLLLFEIHGPFALREALAAPDRDPPPWKRGLAGLARLLPRSSALLRRVGEAVLLRLEQPDERVLRDAARMFEPGSGNRRLEGAWESLARDVRSLAARARAQGSRALFVYFPDVFEMPAPTAGYDTDAVARRFRGIVEREGGAWENLTGAFRAAHRDGGEGVYFRYDPHYTARGLDVAARALAPRIRELLGR